jgi:hypothetical protein
VGALDEGNKAVTRHQFISYIQLWLSFKFMAKFPWSYCRPHVFSNYLRAIPVTGAAIFFFWHHLIYSGVAASAQWGRPWTPLSLPQRHHSASFSHGNTFARCFVHAWCKPLRGVEMRVLLLPTTTLSKSPHGVRRDVLPHFPPHKSPNEEAREFLAFG